MLASFVFVFHVLGTLPNGGNSGWPAEIGKFGFLGVDAFFVISGFAIAISSIGTSPAKFISNRAKRLLPTLIWVGILTFGIEGAANLFGTGSKERWLVVFRDFGIGIVPFPRPDGTFVNFVAWTILAECQFYVIFLFAIVFATLRNQRLTARGVLYLSFIWAAGVIASKFLSLPAVYEILAGDFAGYFILGMLLGLLRKFGSDSTLLAGLGTQLIFTLPLLVNSFQSRLALVAQTQKELGVLVLGALLLLVLLAIFSPNPRSIRATNIMAEFGKASYPLYLLLGNFAMVIFVFLSTKIPVSVAAVIAYLIASLIAILVSYKLEQSLRKGYILMVQKVSTKLLEK